MPIYYKLISIFAILFLYGCATKPQIPPYEITNIESRNQQIKDVTTWQIKGKIAFLSEDERQSANLFWRKETKKQHLNLTTILGINVLSIDSQGKKNTLVVDGKKYQGTDLDHLLSQMTGYQLPIKQLDRWLIGVKSSKTDSITYSQDNFLPTELEAKVNGSLWRVNYGNYKQVNQHLMAHDIKISHEGQLIKIKINEWQLL